MKKPVLLLVEDSQEIQMGVKLLLGDSFDILSFDNAKEPIEFIENGVEFDALLTDMNLIDTQGSGLDVLKAFRKHYPTLPVVLMSGHGPATDCRIEEAIRDYGVLYLPKPLPLDELCQALGCKKGDEPAFG